MEFIEILTEDLVKINLESSNRKESIEELLDLLVAEHEVRIVHQHSALEAILKRERAYSTGIGKGIAVPHARLPFLDECVTALGVSREGIDFDALDGKKAHIIILLLTPSNSHNEHLKTLANIAHLMNCKELVDGIINAESAEEIVSLIEIESENQQ
ncbi:PTS sugar transporter subunit IIA [bacterium]|nr:PTS sugar transporter subunit IIA [bacterium]